MINSRLLPFAAAAAAGIAVSVLGFTFVYGEGTSYMTNDPTACVNCHVMQEQYDGWLQSSHRQVATCNDCHAPHNMVGKYVTKARNGWAHSLAFTTGNYPDELRITPWNLEVTEGACRYCHSDLVAAVDGVDGSEPRPCTSCHSDVGHRGLAPLLNPNKNTSGSHSGVTNDD
jgi:cytochrome c nitrite reductase small subunit